MSGKTMVTSSFKICDTLGKFFTDKVTSVYKTFKDNYHAPSIQGKARDATCTTNTGFCFSPPSLDQISQVVKTSKSGAPSYPCPPKVFHICQKLVSEQLNLLFTMVIQSGLFPDAWKTASVLPLLKKPNLDPKEPSSYSPISRIPFPSKVLEKLLNI